MQNDVLGCTSVGVHVQNYVLGCTSVGIHVQNYVLWDVPLLEFMYLVFARMSGESYSRGLKSLLLCLCDMFRGLINSFVCCLLCVNNCV